MSSGIIFTGITFIIIRHVRGKWTVLKPDNSFKADGAAA
jgi:hypothetical protein